MIVETERLFIREMPGDSFSVRHTVFAERDIMKHYPYAFDESCVRRWIDRNIARNETDDFGLLAVCLKENGRMIGDCGVTLLNINGKSGDGLSHCKSMSAQKLRQ